MVRSLDWRLSQPGFDLSYGKILSSHTDEFWENETDLSVDDYIYIFTNPSAPAGYDTRSIFKRSLTGLNSEFSFS